MNYAHRDKTPIDEYMAVRFPLAPEVADRERVKNLLIMLKAIEAHCRVETTPKGDPVAHSDEGKRIRRSVQAMIAELDATGRYS